MRREAPPASTTPTGPAAADRAAETCVVASPPDRPGKGGNPMLSSLALIAVLAAAAAPAATPAPAAHPNPHVTLDTSKGKIVLVLYQDKAPKTVANFLHYVRAHHYDGTIFHRVISGFMIQGGGFDVQGNEKPTAAPIQNESKNGVSNEVGTISMARTSEPNSATAQFFINVVDNPRLDGNANSWGYTAFGKVIEGMDVVNAIAAVPVGRGAASDTQPVEPVVIRKATVQP
jgi:cyclophilin family peptidyl-prolyl cis-trans isomerase